MAQETSPPATLALPNGFGRDNLPTSLSLALYFAGERTCAGTGAVACRGWPPAPSAAARGRGV